MRTLLIAGLSLLALVPWLTAGTAVNAATSNVSVEDDQYVDGASGNSTTTITAGDTVLWTWAGANEHTVDSNGGAEPFSSGSPKSSGTFSHTFNTPGTYNYICGVHGTAMQGTIVVNAAATATSTTTPQPASTPVPDATNTPDAAPTSTPAAGASATPAAPAVIAPAPGGVPAAGSASPTGGAGAGPALPSAGTGQGTAGFGYRWVALLGLMGGALTATALIVARRREPLD